MTLFGGNGNSGLLNETWVFNADDSANTWTQLTLSNSPSARYGAAMNFDPCNGQILLLEDREAVVNLMTPGLLEFLLMPCCFGII